MKEPDDRRREEEQLQSLLSCEQMPSDADGEKRELFRFVQACREAANAPVDTADVVARSLAVSTQEDLSWRGDARDLNRFLRDRLRSSAALRLAAASLLLHLAALPVVALYVLTEEPAVPEFRVEVGARSAPFDGEREAEPEQDLEIPDSTEQDALLVENSLSWNRHQLTTSRRQLNRADLLVPEWLSERFGLLYGPHQVDQELRAAALPADVLQLELSLDRHLIRPRGSGFAPESSALLDQVAASLDLSAGSSAWLTASALARAESYGLSSLKSTSALALARERLPLGDPRRPLIEVRGDVRAIMPIDPVWLQAVSAHEAGSTPDFLIERFRSAEPGLPR